MPAPSRVPAAVDVWALSLDHVPDALVESLTARLSADERARCARFVREVDRRAFALSRALVRTSLSRYGPTAPRDWRFVTNDHQCPFVDESQAGAPRLYFNLSHTTGLAVVAVCRGHQVGVDVEHVDRQLYQDVADRHFAPAEVRDLRALPEAAQHAAFFEYWTLKEAYIKARGLGLALPLDQFAFSLHGDAPPTVTFTPGFDDAARWQFWQAWPTPAHRLSLAVEREGTNLPVSLHMLPAAFLRS